MNSVYTVATVQMSKLYMVESPILRYLLPGSQGLLLTLFIIVVLTGNSDANTEVIPTIAIKESLINTNRDSDEDESGRVTNLKPGIIVIRDGPRSTLSLAYELNIVRNHGLDEDDRETNLLDFFVDYQHIPGKWVSAFRASSELTNIDPNGFQTTNPDFIGDNTTELHVVAVDSNIRDRLTDTIEYRGQVNADLAQYDEEDTPDTYGYGYLFGLDNERSPNRFLWNTSIDSQTAGDDETEDRIDTFDLLLRYLLNTEWSGFASYTYTDTEFSVLDDEATLLGFTWQPNSRNYISVGAGKRGDENNYLLDIRYTKRHMTLLANYTEDITTARADTLNRKESESIAQPTSQSISTVPVLQKSATLDFILTGNYSTITVSAFQTDRSEATGITENEITTGGRFRYRRDLSPKNSLFFDVLQQETEEIETNDLSEITLSYRHQRSRVEIIDVALSYAEQESTDEDNEYDQTILSAEYRVSF